MKRSEIIKRAEDIISKAILWQSSEIDITPDRLKNATIKRVRYEIDKDDGSVGVMCAVTADISIEKIKGTYDIPPDYRRSVDGEVEMLEVYDDDDNKIKLSKKEKDRLEDAVMSRIIEMD